MSLGSNVTVLTLFSEYLIAREAEVLNRKIESTCPECGKPIYEDENAMTGFCEECSKDK